jgi:hypothetical protein
MIPCAGLSAMGLGVKLNIGVSLKCDIYFWRCRLRFQVVARPFAPRASAHVAANTVLRRSPHRRVQRTIMSLINRIGRHKISAVDRFNPHWMANPVAQRPNSLVKL